MKRRVKPRRVAGRSDHGTTMADARATVMLRAANLCEVRAPGCTTLAEEAHHRLTRRFGPDCPCNLLAVCTECHRDHITEAPATAREAGWAVSKFTTDPPSQVPVRIFGPGEPVLLTCNGDYLALEVGVMTRLLERLLSLHTDWSWTGRT